MLRGQAGERIAGMNNGTWLLQERAGGRSSNGTSHWKLFVIRTRHGLYRVGRLGRSRAWAGLAWGGSKGEDGKCRTSLRTDSESNNTPVTRAVSVPLCEPIFSTDIL